MAGAQPSEPANIPHPDKPQEKTRVLPSCRNAHRIRSRWITGPVKSQRKNYSEMVPSPPVGVSPRKEGPGRRAQEGGPREEGPGKRPVGIHSKVKSHRELDGIVDTRSVSTLPSLQLQGLAGASVEVVTSPGAK